MINIHRPIGRTNAKNAVLSHMIISFLICQTKCAQYFTFKLFGFCSLKIKMPCLLPPDCLNEIFEILEEDKITLHSCLLVNHLWCEISVRILWRDIWGFVYTFPNEQQQSQVRLAILSTLISCLPTLIFKDLPEPINSLIRDPPVNHKILIIKGGDNCI